MSAPPAKVEDLATGVRTIELARPDRRNAVDAPTLAALREALERPPPVVVLGGGASTAFCAGIDLHLSDAERAEVSDGLYALYERMVASDAVIIAALGGAAVGAGAQLALASDLRVADPEAWLRFPGVGHGLAVGAWGLPSLVGRGRALRLCLTMERIGAREACEWGLVDELSSAPWAAALDRARQVAEADAAATARAKRLAAAGSNLLEALASERAQNRAAWSGSIAGLT